MKVYQHTEFVHAERWYPDRQIAEVRSGPRGHCVHGLDGRQILVNEGDWVVIDNLTGFVSVWTAERFQKYWTEEKV